MKRQAAGNPILLQSSAFLALTPLLTDGNISSDEHDLLATTLKILPPVIFASFRLRRGDDITDLNHALPENRRKLVAKAREKHKGDAVAQRRIDHQDPDSAETKKFTKFLENTRKKYGKKD